MQTIVRSFIEDEIYDIKLHNVQSFFLSASASA